jgi:arylsulfatase A-like enzyme
MRPPLLALAGLLLATSAFAAERRPNIVLILADDLGWGDIGPNGRSDWATPNLDRLAREGTNFRRWYTAAVVCAPSRAALMTGRYGIHNGVVANDADLPLEETTIADALRDHGYATGMFGKWHHGRPRPGHRDYIHPLDRGFGEFFGFTDAVHAWQKFPSQLFDGRQLKPFKGYADTLFAIRAVDFIRRHKAEAFFVYLAFTATHFHIEAPYADVAEHQGKFGEKDPARPLNATYAAMVTRLDKEVGRVLRELDDLGLANDTLVVFSSDHGATFEVGNAGTSAFHDSNRPFRGQKRTLWEGGMRVPGLVRWPGHVMSGRVSSDPIHMIDMFPTFLAAAGATAKPQWRIDGRDVGPVWSGKDKMAERTLFWEWRSEGTPQLAAMRGAMKLVITGGSPAELFDVEKDPAERRSVIAEHPKLAKQLQEELKAWLATESEAAKWGRATTK